MRWADVATRNPELAALGEKKLGAPGVVLLGTIRRDGSPRVSPVNPHFWDGELWLSLATWSHKANDAARDARVVVHSTVVNRDGSDGEYKVRGRAVLEEDRAVYDRFAQALVERYGWGPDVNTIRLFKLDVDDITFIDRANRPWHDPAVTRWS
jgi:general stress protein 26